MDLFMKHVLLDSAGAVMNSNVPDLVGSRSFTLYEYTSCSGVLTNGYQT